MVRKMMLFKRFRAIVLACLLILSNTPAHAKTFIDQFGRHIQVPDCPKRIVAMAPSITEIIFALGLSERLVGATQFSDYPPIAETLPKVGSYVHLDVEKIVSLEPDLCIAVKDGNPISVVRKLESVGIPLYAVDPRNLDMRANQRLVNSVMELCQSGDWEGVRQAAAGSKSYVLRILISGILHRDYSLVKAMEAAAADEIARMRRNMGVLDTIITVAPLLGIFGTVLGIISSFDMLGAGGIDHPEAVTKGIAQALITTASGLGIAILTVFPFNYFDARIDHRTARQAGQPLSDRRPKWRCIR